MIKKLTGKKKLTINSIVSRKPRRDVFDERDIDYLKSKPAVKLGTKLGQGGYGQFYTIEGNANLGIKIPHCTLNEAGGTKSCSECSDKQHILAEAMKCHNLKFNDKPMLAPTRAKQIMRDGNKCMGLIRPLVDEVKGTQEEKLTDAQLETLRTKLIALSRQGVVLQDGLQFGFTKSGRLLQFDLGHVDITYISVAFHQNDELWRTLLALAGKFAHCKQFNSIGDKVRCQEKVIEKYGQVSKK